MEPDDAFLLGTDLVKDVDRLVAAYDDAAGVTAEFNRNVLHVVNRDLDADFDPDRFAHVARWDPDEQWIEMWLRTDAAQRCGSADSTSTVEFAAGEAMRTEISAKFTRGAGGGRARRRRPRPRRLVDRPRRRVRPLAEPPGLRPSGPAPQAPRAGSLRNPGLGISTTG